MNEDRERRMVIALEQIAQQMEQQTALIASSAESLRILVEMAERENDGRN
jgi:hypothetical protein